MVKKNDRFKVLIQDWSEKGFTQTKLKNLLLEVPFVLPDEEVLVHITKALSHRAFGKAVSVITGSKFRIDPQCSVFGKCGGCQLQHVNYQTQLNYKKVMVVNTFTKEGLSLPNFNLIPCEFPYSYRNKSQFSIGYSNKGKVQIGLSASRSNRIVDCDSCSIQHPLTNKVLHVVREFLSHTPLPLNHLLTRVGFFTNELMVAFVSSETEVKGLDRLTDYLSKAVPEVKSIYFNFNPEAQWTVLGPQSKLLWGESAIYEEIDSLKLKLSLHSFFQTNSYQILPLWKEVMSSLGPAPGFVWDLYSGTGSMSCYLARHAREVVGVELNPDAIKDANETACSNGIQNISFVQGAAESVLSGLEQACDSVVVDPPRKGLLLEVIKEIVLRKPKQVIYVSCSKETLARDLTLFKTFGYEVDKFSLLDMFPQTYHCEFVVRLIPV